jgi:hypothetical protein
MTKLVAHAAAIVLALALTGCHPATLRLHVIGVGITVVVQPQPGGLRL